MAAAEVRLLTATLSETSKTPADTGVTGDGTEEYFGHADCVYKCRAC